MRTFNSQSHARAGTTASIVGSQMTPQAWLEGVWNESTAHLIRGVHACGCPIRGDQGEEPCAAHHCSGWTVGDGVRRARWRVAPGEKDSRCKRGSNSRCQRTQRYAVAFEHAIRDHDMRNAYFCRAE